MHYPIAALRWGKASDTFIILGFALDKSKSKFLS